MNWHDYFVDEGITLSWKIRPARMIYPGRVVSFKNTHGYLVVKLKGKQHMVHRVLWEMRNGPIPAGMQIDHIDGDRLNNLPGNLRLATHSENCHNRGVQKNSSSGVKGVHWDKARKKWRAKAYLGGKIRHAGYFDDLEEASAAAKNLRDILHGDFARHG